MSTSSIVVDLDHTLCIPNNNETDSFLKYGLAKPIYDVIETVNRLYDARYYILIYTARRMKTHNNDVEKVIADVGTITEEWLSKNGVKYHELRFGKPNADYYVDDKAIRPDEFCRLFGD